MGKKTVDAEKTLMGPSSPISNNQDAQSRGMKVNPWQANSKYSDPAVFPYLLHGIV